MNLIIHNQKSLNQFQRILQRAKAIQATQPIVITRKGHKPGNSSSQGHASHNGPASSSNKAVIQSKADPVGFNYDFPSFAEYLANELAKNNGLSPN